jgi:hypothetical protein
MKDNFPIYLVGGIFFAVVGINLYLFQSTKKVNASGKKKKKKKSSSSGRGGGSDNVAETFNSNRLKNLFVLQRK